jgi:hypothetical protein
MIYFTGCTAGCDDSPGSFLFSKFFGLLDDSEKKEWDILAQVTELTQSVIDIDVDPSLDTQTVHYTSYLTRQLRMFAKPR